MEETLARTHTWSPAQDAIFAWFRDGSGHLLVRARAGCLAGDTVLNLNRAGRGFQMPIEKAVAQWNQVPPLVYRPDLDCYQRSRPWDPAIATRIARADDDCVRLGTIANAWCSGLKQTYTVTTESGRSIRATDEHPFLLESGEWCRLGALTTGARVRVNVGQGGSPHAKKLQYSQTDTRYHPRQVPNGPGRWKVATHRLIVEAYMNQMPFDQFVEILRLDKYRSGNLKYLSETEIVHHRDENVLNNEWSNLQVVRGQKGHSEHHDWTANVLARIGAETVVSIEEFGEELTYDVSVEDAPHCFLANGFVVHNTGKTTTILEAINHAPESQILLCAFNKRIAEELSKRLNASGNLVAEARTLHSLGYSLIRQQWERVDVDVRARENQLIAPLIKQGLLTEKTHFSIQRTITKICSLGRELRPLTTDYTELMEIALEHDATPEAWMEASGFTLKKCAQLAYVAMEAALEQVPTVDYADMLYLPLRLHWGSPTYDLVVVDEAQDMTGPQLELALGLAKGRIVLVGDDRQAIYGFRGADANALDRLKITLAADELGLKTTYRCGSSIVELARSFVEDFLAGDDQHLGEIREASEQEMMAEAGPNDFILSRLNAPLASIALSFLRQGRRVRIQGRDLGKDLLGLAQRIAKASRATTIDDWLSAINSWTYRQEAKIRALGKWNADRQIAALRDRVGTLETIAEDCDDLQGFYDRLATLFADDGQDQIVCSTVHKAKGLEADRVFLIKWTFEVWPPDQEEQNIKYVAITRARQTLVWMTDPRP